MKARTSVLSFSSMVLFAVAIQTAMALEPADPKAPDVHNPPPASQPAAIVRIDNFNFQPKELTVLAGTRVTWKNADDVPHTATSKDDPRLFDSGALDTDDQFSFTFSKPGKYAYFCKVHPHMTGVITVK